MVFTIVPKTNRARPRARHAVATRFICTPSPLLVAVFVLLSSRSAVATEPAPRETVLFNAGWRFQSGDPNGLRDSLDYAHLRSWLLPSGDAYLSANAGHHRPNGNPGQDVPYTQNTFDDRTWRHVDCRTIGPSRGTSFRIFRVPRVSSVTGGPLGNVLAIRLNTPPDASRWYPGAGLYRNVWLLKTSPVHGAGSGAKFKFWPDLAGE
jgi:beta-galactosidase